MRGFTAGGLASDDGLGSTVGIGDGAVVGAAEGVTVVTVSRGSDVGGAAVGMLGRGVAMTCRVGGGPTVAVVEALSPPERISAVAITASTSTALAIAAIGRQRWSNTPALWSAPT